jgi:predicted transcriptional regulator
MKTITINVSEPVYRSFQAYARAQDRSTSELIREAMAVFNETRITSQTTLRDLRPVSLGEVLRPLSAGEDWLGEMLE